MLCDTQELFAQMSALIFDINEWLHYITYAQYVMTGYTKAVGILVCCSSSHQVLI